MSKAIISAKVDVKKIKYSKGKSLEIDFLNQIDVWNKMEFRSREQIKLLQRYGTLDGHEILKDLNSLTYAVREKID